MLTTNEYHQLTHADGSPFFFLADTVWSAFTNPTDEDWIYYLKKRRNQGFNVLQMNILPQWDRSVIPGEVIEPFEVNNGYFEVEKPRAEYFDVAVRRVRLAVEYGFTPALVVLWCNYVPETWGNRIQSQPAFKLEDVQAYSEYVVELFSVFNPIYFISGDTDFPTEKATAYYLKALDTIDTLVPDALKALHIQRGLKEIPETLQQHKGLDLYLYQSGHNITYQSVAYEFGQYFYDITPAKPVINAEPAYEFMGYSRNMYGRFSREDVRKVSWQSVLSGAYAGITYGAHGIWSWHDVNRRFGTDLGEGFGPPQDWRDAIDFEGANDYGYLKKYWESEGLPVLQPNQFLLVNENPEIRVASTDSKVYIYLPVNVPLKVKGSYDVAQSYALDVVNRSCVPLTFRKNDDDTLIEMTAAINDSLLVLVKD